MFHCLFHSQQFLMSSLPLLISTLHKAWFYRSQLHHQTCSFAVKFIGSKGNQRDQRDEKIAHSPFVMLVVVCPLKRYNFPRDRSFYYPRANCVEFLWTGRDQDWPWHLLNWMVFVLQSLQASTQSFKANTVIEQNLTVM